jgi:hypothetical protein
VNRGVWKTKQEGSGEGLHVKVVRKYSIPSLTEVASEVPYLKNGCLNYMVIL